LPRFLPDATASWDASHETTKGCSSAYGRSATRTGCDVRCFESMRRKRKRTVTEGSSQRSAKKRVKSISANSDEWRDCSTTVPTHHPVLSLYYRRVERLRTYLLHQLPSSSKSRRKRLASIGVQNSHHGQGLPQTERDRIQAVANVLDSTLVGVLELPERETSYTRQREFAAFTQSQFRSSLGSVETGATSPQAEVRKHI
jgi:telomerase reverse transcriptase